MLIAEGFALRRVAVAHRGCAELLGSGDLLYPWDPDDYEDRAPQEAFRVLSPLTVTVLDRHVAERLRMFPDLLYALIRRSCARTKRVSEQHAVTTVPNVEARLHLTLWRLAERWGRVTPDGVSLRLPLTHEMLGLLIGARRPSVTCGLGRLALRGVVVPQLEGGWLLRDEPPFEGAPAQPAVAAVG